MVCAGRERAAQPDAEAQFVARFALSRLGLVQFVAQGFHALLQRAQLFRTGLDCALRERRSAQRAHQDAGKPAPHSIHGERCSVCASSVPGIGGRWRCGTARL